MIILILITTLFFTSCSDIFGEDPIYGCLDQTACNYNSNANTSDKTCIYLEFFQGLGYCDCYENILDECGQCGGNGRDSDDDDICDMVDNCPNFWNPGQIDTDGDGLGDACEESSLISYGGLHYTIYPNPFSDYTVINFNNLQSSVKLEIFKLSGQLVYKNVTKEDAIIIYKSNLSRGLYILEITQNTLLTRDVLVIN